MDVLTDILATMRLRGTVYFQADFCAPWGMDIKGGAVAHFHLVVEGSCWLRGPDQDQLTELSEGDMVVLAQGDRHSLVHAPDAEARPANELLDDVVDGAVQQKFGGDGNATKLICGHYELDRSGAHPFLTALPPLIHLSKDEQTDWITTATKLTLLESESREQGSNAVVDRLAEVLLFQVIRAYATRLPKHAGFLAALVEPTMATALSLLHSDITRPWKLADLASLCGTSKTVLVEKFNSTLGQAPIQYLTDWRMHKARSLLIEGSASVAQIAQQVGYASEWSFSKAYKRVYSEGPGATRKSSLS